MRATPPSFPGLTVVIATVMAASSMASAAQPVHLQAPETASQVSPFEAALSNESAPQHDPTRRYLGRPGDHGHSWTDFGGAATDDTGAILWGHSPITLTQYPLTEPRPDQAPDVPTMLPPASTSELACDQSPPPLVLGDARSKTHPRSGLPGRSAPSTGAPAVGRRGTGTGIDHPGRDLRR